jgi:hypothetical protein
MVICFNVTSEAKKALDSLIQTGQFRDISETISMAIINYEVIHKAVKENREVFHADISTAVPLPPAAHLPVPSATGAPSSQLSKQIPILFQLREARPNTEDLLPVQTTPADYKTLSPKDWLFGQWNRFLPVKATSRALLNIMYEHHFGIPVNDAAGKISHAACDLGDYLQMLDVRRSRGRGESVSAAFPSTTSRGAESRLRYENQFVGSIKQGKLTGLPGALRLVAHDSAKNPNLRLTNAGAQFAALPNPLLDPSVPGDKFTDDEIRFLLQHIQSCVPEEVSAFVAIIDSINNGADTPDKMDAFLRARFGLKDEAAMTATFLSTQRT